MKKSIKIKIIIFIVLILLYNILYQFISPLVSNEMAMYQMQNTIDSNLWIQLYTYFSNYSVLIFIVIGILLFNKNIINFIKEKKEKDES